MNSETDQGAKRTRSPGYPVLSLGKAIEATRKMWDAQRKQEAHIDSVLQTLGYTRHGASLRIIAALNHYGLIEESGAKDVRKIRLSESAQDILHLPEADERRVNALKTAALLPTINSALWERYGAHLPEDAVIRPYLIRDKGFSDDIVSDVIQNYRASFELAKLDKPSENLPQALPNSTEQPAKDLFQRMFPPPTVQKQPSPGIAEGSSLAVQELPILVGPNKVARIPFPMTEDDFDLLLGTLNLWKKKIVRSEYPKQAIWTNKDHDAPVTITGAMGERDGVTFYQSSTGTGIPGNELVFLPSA